MRKACIGWFLPAFVLFVACALPTHAADPGSGQTEQEKELPEKSLKDLAAEFENLKASVAALEKINAEERLNKIETDRNMHGESLSEHSAAIKAGTFLGILVLCLLVLATFWRGAGTRLSKKIDDLSEKTDKTIERVERIVDLRHWRPRIEEIVPRAGSTRGGDKVKIAGRNLDKIRQILIGGQVCPVLESGDQELHFQVPEADNDEGGEVDLLIKSEAGDWREKFTYVVTPGRDVRKEAPVEEKPQVPLSGCWVRFKDRLRRK